MFAPSNTKRNHLNKGAFNRNRVNEILSLSAVFKKVWVGGRGFIWYSLKVNVMLSRCTKKTSWQADCRRVFPLIMLKSDFIPQSCHY